MSNTITLSEIQKSHTLHHTSLMRGYVSRRGGVQIRPYKGRFGEGYAVYSANYNSTRYCYITYYVN